MAHDLGAVVVDRGPGTAATLGDATFGGTVSLLTKDPLDLRTVEAYGSAGSYGTYLGGGEIDTGEMPSFGGAKALIDVEHLQSDGFLTYMGQNRTNLFAKIVAPLNDRTKITVAAMYNQVHQNVGLGATSAEYATNGYNYGLNNDPSSQDYFGYNYDQIKTDLAYIGIVSDLGSGWVIDNKLYTYGYWHHGFNGEDPNGETPNGTLVGGTSYPNDVPGQEMRNVYSAVGDIIRVSKELGWATLKTGAWYERQINWRSQWEEDDTLGGGPANYNTLYGPPVDRNMRDTLDTFQPYVEADIKPLPGLTLMPGVKYDYFRRTISADVNQKTGSPLNYAKTYDSITPSVEANYKLTPNFLVYAQAAKGFLAPNLNLFYTTDPSLSTTLAPQSTWNYQAGASYSSGRLALSGDVYYIDFSNRIASRKVGAVTEFYNEGGVVYKGVEGEGTFRLAGGFSIYANGSLNSAKDKLSGLTVANAPKSTAAGGVIYDANNVYASLLAKYVGARFGDDPEQFALPGYTTAQLSVGYTFPRTDTRPAVRITGLIDNLFDKHGYMALAGYTGAAGNPLYWNIVPRSFTLSASVAF
jgi:iron complex outermembrane receptor protein